MKVNFKIKIFGDNERKKNLIYYHLEFAFTWKKNIQNRLDQFAINKELGNDDRVSSPVLITPPIAD